MARLRGIGCGLKAHCCRHLWVGEEIRLSMLGLQVPCSWSNTAIFFSNLLGLGFDDNTFHQEIKEAHMPHLWRDSLCLETQMQRWNVWIIRQSITANGLAASPVTNVWEVSLVTGHGTLPPYLGSNPLHASNVAVLWKNSLQWGSSLNQCIEYHTICADAQLQDTHDTKVHNRQISLQKGETAGPWPTQCWFQLIMANFISNVWLGVSGTLIFKTSQTPQSAGIADGLTAPMPTNKVSWGKISLSSFSCHAMSSKDMITNVEGDQVWLPPAAQALHILKRSGSRKTVSGNRNGKR